MRSELLQSLHCPYSGSRFTLSHVSARDGNSILHGVVTSEAGEFPILAGILRLHVDEHRTPIVEHLHGGEVEQALVIAFDEVPFHGRTGAAINMLSRLAYKADLHGLGERVNRLKRKLARELTDRDATFKETAERLCAGAPADWQIYRFSMPTFLPTFPLLHAVKHDGPILDFCCGTGQASFLMSRMWPNVEMICADYSFSSLYVAKKYFAPCADYVCLDGDYLLPFRSGHFATVFSSDALHCIDSKLSLAQEFQRVGRDNAVIVLPHLHNRLASVQYGKSLTPEGYSKLFSSLERRVMPEEQVVRDYFFDGVLDLYRVYSDEDVRGAEQGLSIVASADPEVFRRYEGLWQERLPHIDKPLINPVYEVSGRPGDWQLKRRTNGGFAKTYTRANEICLPERYNIQTDSLDPDALNEMRQRDPASFAMLAKQLVVLDLPERFQ